MNLKYLLLTQILLFCFCTNAQNSRSKENGLRQNNLINKDEILDRALFHVIYEFSQVAFNEDDRFIQTDKMSLLIGNTYSVYATYNKTTKDSLLEATKKEVDLRRKVVSHYGTYEEFASKLYSGSNVGVWTKSWETADLFKNRQSGKLTIIDELDGVGFVWLEESILPQEWEIGTDTMTILGYTCRDASIYFRGREYMAWFAQDIPVNDGPWKFYGLPGLILQIEDRDKLFKFSAIGIESVKDDTFIKLDKTKKYQEATLKQYRRLKDKNNENVIYYNLQGSELNMFFGENRIKYNPIELEE
jgi:GLPGLI family protein